MATTRSGSSSNADLDDLKAQIGTLQADLAELGKIFADLPKDKIRAARAAAQEQADHARDTAEEYYARAESAARNNPGAAVGIAAGIGFVAGLLLSGRR